MCCGKGLGIALFGSDGILSRLWNTYLTVLKAIEWSKQFNRRLSAMFPHVLAISLPLLLTNPVSLDVFSPLCLCDHAAVPNGFLQSVHFHSSSVTPNNQTDWNRRLTQSNLGSSTSEVYVGARSSKPWTFKGSIRLANSRIRQSIATICLITFFFLFQPRPFCTLWHCRHLKN